MNERRMHTDARNTIQHESTALHHQKQEARGTIALNCINFSLFPLRSGGTTDKALGVT